MKNVGIALFLLVLCIANAAAEPFRLLPAAPPEAERAVPWIRAERAQIVAVDWALLRGVLRGAPLEGTPDAERGPLFLRLPDPEGRLQAFRVVESPIMEPGLAAMFPGLKTYAGQGIDDLHATLRFDTATGRIGGGFHAQVLTPGGSWYIDPWSIGDEVVHASYYRTDLKNPHRFKCHVEEFRPVPLGDGTDITATGPTLRTYRLANACTGEYAQFHGGTVASAQSAIVTAINRVTGIYEREVSLRLVLVANNTSIVYTNPNTDPYTNNNGGAMLSQNQSTCDSIIGSANYDIGHVFSTGGGGIAGLAVVCRAGNKARGVTGLPSPTGDPFYVDYVAHEMGHQFGANHSFNGSSGSCGSNRNSSTAYEPGSGSTIMSYAGICGSDDVQSFANDYFHSISIDEIVSYISTAGQGTCSQNTSTGNNAPTVSAGTNRTIPGRTPFVLTATASDPNGDPLTYCWEQRSLGPAATLCAADQGSIPLFRTFAPTTSPSRSFPRLSVLQSGNTDGLCWEKLPTVNRTMPMRVTVRDGRGGVNDATVTLTIAAAAGPFRVTTANTAVTWAPGSQQTITWDVAGTTANGINCASVNILFSTDAGATFPTVLLAGTPNDGSELVTLPNVSTSQGRLRVEAVGNIFFDINDANITLGFAQPGTPTNLNCTPNPSCPGQPISLTATVGPGEVVDWYTGACGNTLIGTGSPLVITPTQPRNYFARARNTTTGQSSASCASVANFWNSNPTNPTSATVNRNNLCRNDGGTITLTLNGGSGTTVRWFTDSCGGPLAGTGSPLVISAPSRTTTYFGRWETVCGNSACRSVTVNVCIADFNCDGGVDFFDYLDFVQAYSDEDPSADINGDGQVDFFDYLDFVTALNAGC